MKLQLLDPTWDVDYPEYIECDQKATLNIEGVEHVFIGYGESFCDPKDKWDLNGGKLLSYIRAVKDVYNQLENYMIKYFCKVDDKAFNLDDLFKEASITVDNVHIDKNLKDLLFGPPQPTTLDKLVGKWAIRTKPPKGKAWDDSYCLKGLFPTPIFISKFENDSAEYHTEEYPKGTCTMKDEWLDNNWIEYKGGN